LSIVPDSRLTSSHSDGPWSGVSEDGTDGGFDCASIAGVPVQAVAPRLRLCRSLSHAINWRNRVSSGVSRFASQNRNRLKAKPRPSHSQTGIVVRSSSHKAIGTRNDAAIRNFLVIRSPIRESRYAKE